MWRVFAISVGAIAILVAISLGGFTYLSQGVSGSVGVVATSTIQEEVAAYKIHIYYPQFGIASIDKQIRKNIDDAVAEFKTFPQNPHDSATPQNTFDGLYDSVYIGPDFISAKLILSQYTGGAHPMTLFSGVNYDPTTGTSLLLDDALKLIGKTVGDISEASTAQFKTKFGDGFFSEGATTNPENFSSFVISKDTVTFIFQQYQVAAYAYGPQEMSFPRVK